MLSYAEHGDKHVIELIKFDHPEWVEKNGLCQKCIEYYKAEIAGSVFKDVSCVKRIRFLKKIIRSIKIFFLKTKATQNNN